MVLNQQVPDSHDLEGLERILQIDRQEATEKHETSSIRFERQAWLPDSGLMLSGKIRLGKWDLLFPSSGSQYFLSRNKTCGKNEKSVRGDLPDMVWLECLVDHISLLYCEKFQHST